MSELRSAWRLAYVVVGDVNLATRALAKAYHGPALGVPSSIRKLDLLADTLRISLTRAAVGPPHPTESAVITALWALPAEQRAALWLSKVECLDQAGLGSVLGLTSANAIHVAARADEWLDVTLDHDSGPLCPLEVHINDFLHHRLQDDESKDMAAHLPECVTCRTKVRAVEEVGDLKGVLDRAVPEPPLWLNVEALDARALPELEGGGPSTLQEVSNRTPAVRPLVACCVALLILGVVGLRVIGPDKTSTGSPASGNPHGILSGSAGTAIPGGLFGTSTLPPQTATTVVVTTSSIPTLTFPTVPRSAARKGTTRK
ncbi:MAG TPA: hypothetical protein VHT30_08880 [Acidimicrobiales bacterium]|jgi:hypothetical protein|nr:hypothetical protein [Acidimicrobiales bacterium]